MRTALAAAGAAAALTGCGATGLPQGSDPVSLNPDDFSATIDNTYWPMKPGTRWTYREIGEDGEVQNVVVTVTGKTTRIKNGVTARIVRDTVRLDGKVIEDTFDWYAQNADGSIWYLGEDTAEFEHGRIASREGSFEAGVHGAQAGVIIPADPKPGQAYRQEYLKGEAEDNGEVLSTHEMADVPAGHFKGMLLTKDTNGVEPDVLEYKLYAPGVGPVLTLGVAGDVGREELVKRSTVSAEVAARAGTAPLGKHYG
jgi:hypothetical protein